MRKFLAYVLTGAIMATCLALTGCLAREAERPPQNEGSQNTAYAGRINFNTDKLSTANPLLRVYDVKRDKISEMRLEKYLEGVLAGEMPGDWPLEALKAQAILARTFVCKFIDEKASIYENADISTDIKEAQAYSEADITDAIKSAVSETAGEVLSVKGRLPYAWFFSHGGGTTALAREGLGFKGSEPEYTRVTDSMDADVGPEDVKSWTARFTASEVRDASESAGVDVGSVTRVEMGRRGPSGRLTALIINGHEVSAPEFRLAIGSSKMKSTLIDSLRLHDAALEISGRGYGHGVGMSQWGAFALARDGMKAEEIVKYYFKNSDVVKL